MSEIPNLLENIRTEVLSTKSEVRSASRFATLKKGRNEVRLWNDRGRMPDVDYMIVDDEQIHR